ncbi:sulfite exporter TauE/SafE family protein [Agarilytica rhodophyticola]|uniref:sulfite exporter TauE/SafE family protein n=1 Tax=Agarilytica rhodophyticola TaxID=1737490 RepID=UPI000B3427BE|nr:sulfite exporter TauE/SafE family protein [Agarilytica rhodophyticola]
MIEWLPIVLALLFTGVVAGILAGLLGVGGGIVIVPVLYFIFQGLGINADTAMSIATGTSLLTIIPTSISSIRAHHQRGNIDLDIIKLWSPFIILGVVAGSIFATRAGGGVASAVFGCVALLVAANMLFRASAAPMQEKMPNNIVQAIFASIVGAISVVMGIGGGTLGVPLLSAFNTAAHRAVGTAAVFGLVIAAPGALLMLTLASTPTDAPAGTIGFANIYGFALIVPLTILTAPLGVKIGSSLDSAKLKRVFAVFLAISASRMIYQSFFS